MSFPRYPAYKDSGVEWLGEVPEHWEALPLRRLIREVTSGTSVNAIDEPASPGQAGVLKTSCVYTGEFRPEENKAILESELYRATCTVVAGSLVVSRMNTPDLVGAAGLVKNDDPFLFLPDRLWLVSFQDCDPQFMNYWCKSISYRSQIQLACSGTSSSMQNLSQDNFYSFIAPLPPTGEQSAIATFLDRETAKIDALIAEQQRLIELLQEKRQAVISHAVTKGLNPDAPMKDSGVEWLGEVPEHWSLARLKHAAKEKVAGPYGASLTKSMYTGAGYRVYGQQQVIPDNFEEGDYYIDRDKYEEMKRYSVSPGDVLISVMGTVGKVAVVPDFVEPGIINPRLVRYHLRDLLIPRFAQKLLLSTPFQEKILLEAKGATMDGLNMHILGDLPLPVPPRVEQEAILDQLHRSLASFDAMSSSVEESILLLKERRSALISAAVTGQIDVRGLVPEAVAA
jgi:type I restriction enzyme, S subunit